MDVMLLYCGLMERLNLDETKLAMDRFRGEAVEARSTFAELGARLPGRDPEEIVLGEIEIRSEMYEVGQTRAERRVLPREHRRFLDFGDDAKPPWRMPEEHFEGGCWLVPDRELKISGAVGAVIVRSRMRLPSAPRTYTVIRIEANGSRLDAISYEAERRLLVKDRISVEGHFWTVERIDNSTENALPVAFLRR
jgi:hypothetical protein